jgi:hypothetical protein
VLERPEPVPIRVTSRASRSQFIAALTQAVAERRYSNANETTLRIYHGSVVGNAVSLTVKTYFLPGIWARGNINKVLTGSINDAPTGSELVGLVTAPISRTSILVIAGWMAVLAVACGLIAGFAAFTQADATDLATALLLAITVGVAAVAVAVVLVLSPAILGMALIARHNQRTSLREVDRLSRFLQTIASEAETR